MPSYRFHIENGPAEDHVMNLPDDGAAVAEGLRTAADLVSDISLDRIGAESHTVQVSEGEGAPVFRVEIRAVRSR
jgi:hypothetical protein